MPSAHPIGESAGAARRRVWLLLAITALYVAGLEWAAFHRGLFWDLEPHVNEMPGRWHMTTRFGGYLRDRRTTRVAKPGLIILGSSVVGTGFKHDHFVRAWRQESGVPPMPAENAWIMGAVLPDLIVASQYLATPAPRFLVFGLTRRDVIEEVPIGEAIVVQAFYRADMLPLRPGQARGPWTVAQQLFREMWPAYRHRLLVQQLALRYRPGLHRPRTPGRMELPVPDEMWDHERARQVRTTGADIALLGPWATWCHERGIRPVVLIMPVRSDRYATDLVIDGPRSYLDRIGEVAAANDIWLFNFATAGRDEEFVEEDGVHNTGPGAVRTSESFARALADRVRREHGAARQAQAP